MRYRAILILLPLLALLAGCSVLQGGKLFAPETFGFERIAAYGSVEPRPIVHACITEQCLESFGGKGTFAKVYGNRILLSPRGLTWHFIAHEWSHAEMLTRLGFFAWRRMPQWFDDGVAVAISEAPGARRDRDS